MLKMLDLSLLAWIPQSCTLYRVYESIAVENLSLFITLSAINMLVVFKFANNLTVCICED